MAGINAAAWFSAQSFGGGLRATPASPAYTAPERPTHVYDRWDAEARCWRTYHQWADGRVEEVPCV